ncbi:hypothetical protein [Priestia megaterium]|uniref:hypothetical protein n=1 Tax=Priestia megaterium TaxID=1404 RepID=UPI0024536D8A|nr:hypothetical protein [Priestia megaterium]MDH3183545.1 hypothetical protein [Priestia megaterium]MDH3183585.1 hypothetical protein [Priestia megaterium]
MYHTEYGEFDGDSWELFSQKCLKIRYWDDGYQPIEAHFGGDLGIEGYTRSGIVFQCYCPDENYDPDPLYEHQRDKITADLKKLITYKEQLIKYLGGIKIKKWIFLTPRYIKKDILLHCNKKRDEYRSKKLVHLDEEFDVLIQDIDFFAEEMRVVLEMTKKRISIEGEDINDQKVHDWSQSNNSGVTNTIRKITATFPSFQGEKINSKVMKLVDKRINEYLKGGSVLARLEKTFPDQFEKFIKVIDDIETDIEDLCMYPCENNQKLFGEIQDIVEQRLKGEFGEVFDSVMLSQLKRRVISDWLMRCPIDFDN